MYADRFLIVLGGDEGRLVFRPDGSERRDEPLRVHPDDLATLGTK